MQILTQILEQQRTYAAQQQAQARQLQKQRHEMARQLTSQLRKHQPETIDLSGDEDSNEIMLEGEPEIEVKLHSKSNFL